MGSAFLQNLVGVKLDDQQMKDIPYPSLELHIHVMEKTIQAGSLVGGWIVPLAVHAFNRRTSLFHKMARYGRNGFLIGIPLGPIMTYGRLQSAKADEAAIYDRSYRLRYNKGQLNVDRACFLGGLTGLIAGRLVGASSLAAWFGMVNGINLGIVGSAFYNAKTHPPPPPKKPTGDEYVELK